MIICDSDVVERSLNLVFDDVLTTELRGSIPQPEAVLKMFFREPRSRRGAVTFTSLRVEAAIALVNLQNVAHLTVDPDSRFRRVDNLEIIQRSVDTKVRGTGSTKHLYIRCSDTHRCLTMLHKSWRRPFNFLHLSKTLF